MGLAGNGLLNVAWIFSYDPYKFSVTEEGLKGSTVITNGYGWCVPKANLLAAVCRCAGIPARLGVGFAEPGLRTEFLLWTGW